MDGKASRLWLLGGDDKLRRSNDEGTDGAGQLKNDVWFTEPGGWKTQKQKQKRGRNEYGKKNVYVESLWQWTEATPGRVPPAGVTHKEWIQCQDYFEITNPSHPKEGIKSIGNT